jgi:hypothetical protein
LKRNSLKLDCITDVIARTAPRIWKVPLVRDAP